eukprot:gb/GECG01015955.1/.p1 GENE.gb/GECG01015955.1/~~gb/GECG01015955.1/.p1  ORF type:complete len:189 (+),score=34.84 gb/GECG01015955.1/:1-567(+)
MAASLSSTCSTLQPILERYKLGHEVDEETETYIKAAIEESNELQDVQDLLVGFVLGYEELAPQTQEQLADELRRTVMSAISTSSEQLGNFYTETTQEHSLPPDKNHPSTDRSSSNAQPPRSGFSSDSEGCVSARHDENVSEETDEDSYPEAQNQLREMFPSASAYLLRRITTKYGGDVQVSNFPVVAI